jgi:hypothetical protein
VVDAFSYYHNKKNTIWENSIDYVKDGVRKYSEWVGEYGYPVVQAVEGPANNSSGGMEYPMVTLITSPSAKKEALDGVIAHEIGIIGLCQCSAVMSGYTHGWMKG